MVDRMSFYGINGGYFLEGLGDTLDGFFLIEEILGEVRMDGLVNFSVRIGSMKGVCAPWVVFFMPSDGVDMDICSNVFATVESHMVEGTFMKRRFDSVGAMCVIEDARVRLGRYTESMSVAVYGGRPFYLMRDGRLMSRNLVKYYRTVRGGCSPWFSRMDRESVDVQDEMLGREWREAYDYFSGFGRREIVGSG
jgi:hypothetical protein